MDAIRQALIPGFIICSFLLIFSLGQISKADISLADAGANCQISEQYPAEIRRWCNDIQSSAAQYNLEPNLVAALILQESGGNPTIVSHSGAVGLMQVMPRDGIAASFMCGNHPCFMNRPSMAELNDPAYNIAFGCEMLSGLIYRHGNLREALRFYGPQDAGYSYADKVLAIYNNYQ